ncbi:MAG: hypothetical protein JNM66_12555 [Bryobacterales bacterium]|nr:hypothetical protein [Bryobacterales bacterium]
MKRTVRTMWLLATLLALAGGGVFAEWRHVGTAAMDLRLSGLATGPVDGVGWSADGGTILARTAVGRWLATEDGETWKTAAGLPAAGISAVVDRLPEPRAQVVGGGRAGWAYAYGDHVWRTEDNGRSWRNLTQWKQTSLLGGPVSEAAVRPGVPEEIVVSTATGVWKSADAGLTWASLNAALPQLPVRRIVSLPRETTGLRVAMLAPSTMTPAVFEWAPGERSAWQPVPGLLLREQLVRSALAREFGTVVTALGYSGDTVYAGTEDGRIFVSLDRGGTWMPPAQNPGAVVESFSLDTRDPRRAVVSLRRREAGAVVLRTTNGGLIWDDVTANLGLAAVYGVAASFESGAIYAATEAGIYWTATDLTAMGPATAWKKMGGSLPDAPVFDVKLDDLGQTLYAAVYGYGIYAETTPHRMREWKIVSAADWTARAAAPGSLMSVLGGKVQNIRAGERPVLVLSRGERETQIQLPYDLQGTTVSLSLEAEGGLVRSNLPLAAAAPAILVDRDGTPMAMDGANGALLDGSNPARGGSLIQVLASGLGRVSPEWPVGMAAPMGESAPVVLAPVKAYMDGSQVEVVRATLAPGYIGYYLVEVRLPDVVNSGTAELFLEAGNSPTNKVRLYIEP